MENNAYLNFPPQKLQAISQAQAEIFKMVLFFSRNLQPTHINARELITDDGSSSQSVPI